MTRLTRILFVGWQGVPDNKADTYIVCRGGKEYLMTRLTHMLFVGWQGVPDDKAGTYIVCRIVCRVARST